jgi:hypothetical protein
MGSKISQIKTQKKEIKPNNQMRPNQNYPAHMLMRQSTSDITQNCSKHSLQENPAPEYQDLTTTVET